MHHYNATSLLAAKVDYTVMEMEGTLLGECSWGWFGVGSIGSGEVWEESVDRRYIDVYDGGRSGSSCSL